jgi:hypothetical protein
MSALSNVRGAADAAPENAAMRSPRRNARRPHEVALS